MLNNMRYNFVFIKNFAKKFGKVEYVKILLK